MRFDALTALYTLLAKQRASEAQIAPLLTAQAQLVPLVVQSMDEDWYVETRRLGCFVMRALLTVAGGAMNDEMRRQIYPELTKRMDDSNNGVRVAAAGTITVFARAALPAEYCDTNSKCVR